MIVFHSVGVMYILKFVTFFLKRILLLLFIYLNLDFRVFSRLNLYQKIILYNVHVNNCFIVIYVMRQAYKWGILFYYKYETFANLLGIDFCE